MADVVGYLANLLNTQAQTNLINAQAQDQQQVAQLNGLRVQQIKQRQQDEALAQQTFNSTISGQTATQFRGDQPVETGDPNISALTKTLTREQNQATQLRNLADTLGGRVSPDYQKELQKQAEEAETKALETDKELRLRQQDLRKDIGSTAGAGLQSDEAFKMAYQKIAAVNPQMVAGVDRNTQTGIPYLGENSKRIFSALKAMGETSYEQDEVLQRAQNAAREQANLEREIARNKQQKLHEDQEVANQRMAERGRQERHAETLAAAGIRYNKKDVDTTQKAIDSLAKDSKLGDFKAAADVASRIESKLVDPSQGYASVTPEDARQLVEQAKRLQQNFRSFGSAGKMQESEIRNMNSFLEGYEKWIQSVGKGDPILAKDQMLNLAESMKNVYADRNAEQVKQELQRTKVMADKGNNPNFVITRGNIDDLKEQDRAFEVQVKDKKYLAIVPPNKIRKGNETQKQFRERMAKELKRDDLFEIPEAPKPPTFVPVPE